jgi:hypothetical protein
LHLAQIDDVNKKNSVPVVTEEHCDVQFDAVVTIAPRHDASSVDSEIPEAMVTCICQVGLNKGNWQKGTGTVLCSLKHVQQLRRENMAVPAHLLWCAVCA